MTPSSRGPRRDHVPGHRARSTGSSRTSSRLAIDYAGITMLICLGVGHVAHGLRPGRRHRAGRADARPMIEQLWSDLIEFTSQFIIPDWGALISLLPVFLAIPVVLFITWTIYSSATAGPTRRGKRRLPPVAAAGHPHARAVVRAVPRRRSACSSLVFGLVVGGIWLARRRRRPRPHAALLGPRGAARLRPHPGRRRPARRRRHARRARRHAARGRPHPAALVPPDPRRDRDDDPRGRAGRRRLAAARRLRRDRDHALGWLLDARKEYVAVEHADRTGHLDMGGSPAWPKATFAGLAVLVVVGASCSRAACCRTPRAATAAARQRPAPAGWRRRPPPPASRRRPCRPRT